MRTLLRILLGTLLGIGGLLWLPAAATAQPPAEFVRVSTAWSDGHARPADQRVLAVVFDMADGWHINPDAARTADLLIPTSVEVVAADTSLTVGMSQFPKPQPVVLFGEPVPAYQGRAVVWVPVAVSPGATDGAAGLSVAVTYQACNDSMCLPPETVTLDAVLTVASAAGGSTPGDPALFAGFDWSSFGRIASRAVPFDLFGWRFRIDPSSAGGWALLLLVAAMGGLLLNFTPCVLPVIPIKVMGLSYAAGNRARCFGLGLAMSLGVVAFWLAIGGAIAWVSGFNAINELFQQVWFTLGVGVVIAALAVGMCGLFTVALPHRVYQISPRHDTLPGSFGFGIMAAVLSTPCTAPFMGSAAAWATTQPPSTTLASFAAIGGGMALPYLVLAAFPRLVDRVPRTGPASELVKQVMGLLLLAAASYFIGVGVSTLTAAGPPETPTDLYWWPVMFFLAAAATWLVYRAWRITTSTVRRLAWTALGGATILVAGFGTVRLTADPPIDWVPYSQARFEQELARGHVVVMDFTAQWCLNCKALEHAVLYDDRVVRLFENPGVVPMKVDITSSANVEGAAMLDKVGGVAIPLLIVFDPTGEPVFRSSFYTVDQVVHAVEAATR